MMIRYYSFFHLTKIEDPKAFQETINQGITEAVKDRLVTLELYLIMRKLVMGIESYEKLSIKNPHSKIKSFVEKPSLNLQKSLLITNIFLE